MVLVQDDKVAVRSHLADNPSLHLEVQVMLAQDDNKAVRWHLARNPKLTKEAKAILRGSK
jgi:hypothetical protein